MPVAPRGRHSAQASINTLAIFEQFRPLLGEEAARNFAATLEGMLDEARNAVTKEDFRILRDSIDANVSRLDAAIAKLAESQQHLWEAQARTEVRVEELSREMSLLVKVVKRLGLRILRQGRLVALITAGRVDDGRGRPRPRNVTARPRCGASPR